VLAKNGTSYPKVKAPWFGYMMFQAAVAPRAAEEAGLGPTAAAWEPGHFATITSAAASPACDAGQVKVWPVIHKSSIKGRKELRVVVLNKGVTKDCLVTLHLTEAYMDGYLTRVEPVARGGLKGISALEATYGKVNYTMPSPELNGTPLMEKVPALDVAGRVNSGCQGTSFSFMVGKASAAVLMAHDKPDSVCALVNEGKKLSK
jgi:hypothetical protein